MPDYKIVKLSSQPPRTWSFTDKRTNAEVQMETYKVMIEGEVDPVDVNRKPGNAPKEGEILTGTLEATDFGLKFKPDRKPGGFAPKDQEGIKAQWAIGQAVSLFTSGKDEKITDIEKNAKDFFLMVDRVKAAKPAEDAPKSGYDNAKEVAARIKETFRGDGPPPDDMNMPMNLDEIPF